MFTVSLFVLLLRVPLGPCCQRPGPLVSWHRAHLFGSKQSLINWKLRNALVARTDIKKESFPSPSPAPPRPIWGQPQHLLSSLSRLPRPGHAQRSRFWTRPGSVATGWRKKWTQANNKPTDHPANPSIDQSTNDSVNQFNQATNQPTKKSADQSINKPKTQSLSPSVNQSITQSITQSINQSINFFARLPSSPLSRSTRRAGSPLDHWAANYKEIRVTVQELLVYLGIQSTVEDEDHETLQRVHHGEHVFEHERVSVERHDAKRPRDPQQRQDDRWRAETGAESGHVILVLESSGAHPLSVHKDKNDGVHLQGEEQAILRSKIIVKFGPDQRIGKEAASVVHYKQICKPTY